MAKGKHWFIDHTADILFRAQGSTLEEVFAQCGLALEETQIDLAGVKTSKKVTFSLQAKDRERLLFEFLEELLFYKDSELILFSSFILKIKKNRENVSLTCTAAGEKLDLQKHEPRVDVKAITLHEFYIKKISSGWEAQVLVDI